MIKCRHGLMIVGPSYAGKSTCYKILAKAISKLANETQFEAEKPVQLTCLNPKSITSDQLYGYLDPISQEFADGVLGQHFRKAAYTDVGKNRQWMVFDGPVDANWIENMNTVLDDNKRLCLMNGEVIIMNDYMNIIFETADLSKASPATVSRCGMVYMHQDIVGWEALFNSWISTMPKEMDKMLI